MRKALLWLSAGAMAAGAVAAIGLTLGGGREDQADGGRYSAPSLPPQAVSVGELVVEPRNAYKTVYEEVSSIAFTFDVINTSGRTVEIRRIMPDCGCTSVQIGVNELRPQEKTVLKVVYDAHGLFGELPRKRIRVLYNGAAKAVVECLVAGYRYRRFIITPPTADLGVVLTGERHSATVTVATIGPGMELVPRKIMVDSPWVTIDVLDNTTSQGAGGKVVLGIGLKKETPQGSVEGRVFVPRTQDDGIGPIIPVRATISGPVRLVPPSVFTGIMPRDGMVNRTVEVKPAIVPSPKGRGVVIVTGFKDASPGLRLFKAEHDPSLVHVTVAAGETPPGQFERNAIIECTVDGKPCEVLLSVCGMVIE